MVRLNLRLFVSIAILAIAIGWVLISKNYLTCQVIYKTDKTVEVGEKTITVEIADDPAEKAQGLGGRECIGEDQGMLFIFGTPGQYDFWMKDMKFPIDIIWIGEDKKIVHLEHDISPATFPKTFTNDLPAKYVLELPAGKAAKLGIGESSFIRF